MRRNHYTRQDKQDFLDRLHEYKKALFSGKELVVASVMIHAALGRVPKSWRRMVTKAFSAVTESKQRMTKQAYRIQAGKAYWFEYRCTESHDSADAQAWYHSHQRATVMEPVEAGNGQDEKERGINGQSAVFQVQFKDGKTFDVFEDELLDSKKDFTQPKPPKDPNLKPKPRKKRWTFTKKQLPT